ncbi:hypothetical protein WJ969_21445 [Achromobacter xylosoxidans]
MNDPVHAAGRQDGSEIGIGSEISQHATYAEPGELRDFAATQGEHLMSRDELLDKMTAHKTRGAGQEDTLSAGKGIGIRRFHGNGHHVCAWPRYTSRSFCVISSFEW